MYSRVILLGRFTHDPELRHSPQGTEICSFSLAVDSGWGEKKKVSYIDCTAFNKRAETIAQYMEKGSPILLEGRLEQSRWEDKDTGQKRSKVGVIVDNFTFMPKTSNEQGPTTAPTGDDCPF